MRLAYFLTIALLSAAIAAPAELPRQAPPLDLPTPSGERISLDSWRGKVVLLEFFLTDCPHCQRSAGVITPLYKEWRSRGLEVLAVAINPDAALRIPEFKQRFGVNYPIAIGNRLTLTTFADLSAVARFYVPYMFLIDRQGMIRYEHVGTDRAFYDNEDANLRAQLDELLKEPSQVRKTARKSPSKS